MAAAVPMDDIRRELMPHTRSHRVMTRAVRAAFGPHDRRLLERAATLPSEKL
jgi:hypothetical protein